MVIRKRDGLIGKKIVSVKRDCIKQIIQIKLNDGTYLKAGHDCFVDDIGTAYIEEEK